MSRRVLAVILPAGTLVALAVAMLSLHGCPMGDRALTADPRLPARVRQISLESQNKGAGLSDVHREIRASYGEPSLRDGTTELWNIDNGLLTYDPVAGIFFVSRMGEMIRVVRNQNPLERSLFGSYEMATPPDPRHQHARYYLGDLELKVDGSYRYQHAQFREPRPDQANNFFILHPSGTYQLAHLNGYTPKTLLESIPGNPRIAKLTFRAADGAEKTYFIALRANSGRLVFESHEGMEFEMDMMWGGRWG